MRAASELYWRHLPLGVGLCLSAVGTLTVLKYLDHPMSLGWKIRISMRALLQGLAAGIVYPIAIPYLGYIVFFKSGRRDFASRDFASRVTNLT